MNINEQYQRKRETIYNYNGVDLPINEDDKNKCIPKMIEQLADEFKAAQYFHSKVLVVRLDLHTNKHSDVSNKCISDTVKQIKVNLKRNYFMNNIGACWVREYGKDKGIHFHLVLLLDGNKVQNSYALIEKIKTYWEIKHNYGIISVPTNCYTQIIRGDEQAFNDAFYRSSYLAKERSKFVGGYRSFAISGLSAKQRKLAA